MEIVLLSFGSHPHVFLAAWITLMVVQLLAMLISRDAMRSSLRALPWQIFLVGLLVSDFTQYAPMVAFLYFFFELLYGAVSLFQSLER